MSSSTLARLTGCALLFLSFGARAFDSQSIPLWPGGPPGRQTIPTRQVVTERSKPPAPRDRYVTGVTVPVLTVFRPQQPRGISLLIVPGGGYQRVVVDKEGYETAEWFAERGVTAFVLLYRLPGEHWTAGPDTPLQDTQRAMRWVRHHATEYGIKPNRIGVIGFSAGGHAAATLATRFDDPVYEALDEIDRVSARPDFVALIYPVISMRDNLAHSVSRDRLLGDAPTADAVVAYSPELHVSAGTPPTFLVHAADDDTVPVGNSLEMFASLQKAGVRSELHIFERGGHGFGLRHVDGKPIAAWPVLLSNWLNSLQPE